MGPVFARLMRGPGVLVGSWSAWSHAAAFGPRLLIGLGLAALFEVSRGRWGAVPDSGFQAWRLSPPT